MILNALATAFSTLGVGFLPYIPGTYGSLLGLLVWWAIRPTHLVTQTLMIVSALLIGWVATHFYEKWNHRHDPKEVVVDEVIGMWITLFAVPAGIALFVIGFILFRLFDIRKPGPVGWIDKNVPGAFGTILDDVVAGLMALFCLHLGNYLFMWAYAFMIAEV